MKKSYVIGFVISMGLLMWFLIDEGHASYPLKQAQLNITLNTHTPSQHITVQELVGR